MLSLCLNLATRLTGCQRWSSELPQDISEMITSHGWAADEDTGQRMAAVIRQPSGEPCAAVAVGGTIPPPAAKARGTRISTSCWSFRSGFALGDLFMNILILWTDEQRADTLSCYGGDSIGMPTSMPWRDKVPSLPTPIAPRRCASLRVVR